MQLPNFHNSSHKSEHYYRYLEAKQNVIETQQMKNQQLQLFLGVKIGK